MHGANNEMMIRSENGRSFVLTLLGQEDRGLFHCRSPCMQLQLCSWFRRSYFAGFDQTEHHTALESRHAVPPSPSSNKTSLNLHTHYLHTISVAYINSLANHLQNSSEKTITYKFYYKHSCLFVPYLSYKECYSIIVPTMILEQSIFLLKKYSHKINFLTAKIFKDVKRLPGTSSVSKMNNWLPESSKLHNAHLFIDNYVYE